MSEPTGIPLVSEQSSAQSPSADAAILGWMHDFAPYGLLTTDSAFNVHTWNHWMVSHTGKTFDEVRGRSLLEIFPDLKERRLLPRFERALQGETSILSTALHHYLFRMDSPVRESGFSEMQQTARIAPLILEKQIIGTIIVVEDVTQREFQSQILTEQHERETILSWALAHLLESQQPRRSIRELFLKIAEHLDWEAYLLYLFDSDKQTLKLQAAGGVSPEVEAKLSVLSAADPLGAALLAADIPEPGAKFTNSESSPLLFEKFGFSASAILPLQSNKGQIGVLCFGARSRASLREGELDLLSTIGKYLSVVIHREATHLELTAAKATLNDYAETLERQVAERTAELREIIADLERFSYSLAHDLRAPIRALTIYSEVLRDDFSPALPSEAQFVIGNIHRACLQLDDLTRDLLEFSKVSRSDLTFTSVDLEELVATVLGLLPQAQSSVTVRRPLHPVLANRALLQQVILNLVDNAIKFAKEDQPPAFSIWTEIVHGPAKPFDPVQSAPFSPARAVSAPQSPTDARNASPGSSQRVRIVVEDQGIGIAPELHRKIFGIFERGTSSPKFRGSGIGLAIVARAIERMGGICGVESTPGIGSRFWLELEPA